MPEQEAKVEVSPIPKCAGCGEPIEPGESCYALQSGYIDENGDFVRQDMEAQLFHLGNCLNSED